jgi:hypothetical protein
MQPELKVEKLKQFFFESIYPEQKEKKTGFIQLETNTGKSA